MDEQQFWEIVYALVILRGGDTGQAQQAADHAADDWRTRWSRD